MPQKKYTWYVEPRTSRTNEVLARLLPEEEAQCSIEVQGDLQISAWRCDYKVVTRLRKERQALGLQYRVYVQEGNGTIRRRQKFEKPPHRARQKRSTERVPF